VLVLQDIQAGYAGFRGAVLRDLQISVEPGTFVCVLGRNGVGKSTLMRTIAGLQPALAGLCVLDGKPVSRMSAVERARKVAVVLTERPFSPGLTVHDVIALGRQPFTGWLGRLRRADLGYIDWAISATGIQALSSRFFDSLSDGERQRAMIARAIAQDPLLMVLDEVTAYLDLPGRVEVMTLLRQQAREKNLVVLLSSHDLDLSLQLADQVWLIDRGTLSVGTPQDLIHNGIIGQAFDTASVVFSRELGRFTLKDKGVRTAFRNENTH